eukprot:6976671-Prymnesium_polylepis.1
MRAAAAAAAHARIPKVSHLRVGLREARRLCGLIFAGPSAAVARDAVVPARWRRLHAQIPLVALLIPVGLVGDWNRRRVELTGDVRLARLARVRVCRRLNV